MSGKFGAATMLEKSRTVKIESMSNQIIFTIEFVERLLVAIRLKLLWVIHSEACHMLIGICRVVAIKIHGIMRMFKSWQPVMMW